MNAKPLFVVGSPAPYDHFCRLCQTPPKWDGHEYEDGDGYFRVSRRLLELLGLGNNILANSHEQMYGSSGVTGRTTTFA